MGARDSVKTIAARTASMTVVMLHVRLLTIAPSVVRPNPPVALGTANTPRLWHFQRQIHVNRLPDAISMEFAGHFSHG